MKYEVVIEETISQKFLVQAASADDALRCAKQLYKNGSLVLDQADLTHKQIACVTDGEITEWEEF
jgi:hypothetical protein